MPNIISKKVGKPGRPKGRKDSKPRSRRSNIQIQMENDTFDLETLGKNYYELRKKMYPAGECLTLLGYGDSRRHGMKQKARAGSEPEKLFFLELARAEERLRKKYIDKFIKVSENSPAGMNNVVEKMFPQIPRKVNQLAVDYKVLEEMRTIVPEVGGMFIGALLSKKVPPKWRIIAQEAFVELFNNAIENREDMLELRE